MSTAEAALRAHLAAGNTTVCLCWVLKRPDGQTQGFTDHDRPLGFDGVTFKPDSGLSAKALQQTTGLAVDNTEALGALSDVSISEADIEAGRLDGAEIQAWQVNWSDPEQRRMIFRGNLGEITRAGSTFRAEVRGLADRLNQPRGRVYQAGCSAVLGDQRCKFDTGQQGFRITGPLTGVNGARVFEMSDPGGFAKGWFVGGSFKVEDGAASGLVGAVKRDQSLPGTRRLHLWEDLRALVAPGDTVTVTAGCDKSMNACRKKFNNLMNFRGFPHIPGEDWQMSYPRRSGSNNGGSLT